ncbi:hypothetical protein evm_009251 [Chilo suppressalis]|nr:hypothetical protein evm_009251 [Chilo suppressalis]
MAPSESPPRELDSKHEDKIVKFVSDIRNGKIEGSNNIALTTLSLLEQIITECENATALELSGVVREVGRRLCRALPQELVAANMARRVLRAIRDEHRLLCEQSGGATSGTGTGTEGSGDSLQRLVLAAHGGRRTTLGAALPHLREPLRDHIAEVVIGVRAVLAGGALLARAGTHGLTIAAKHYSVPVIALCPLYKLSPLHACDRYALSALDCPRPSMLYDGGSSPSYIYRLLSELYDPKDHQL